MNVVDVLEEVVKGFEDQIKENLSYQNIQRKTNINADKERIQKFLNLISNAIKYTKVG